MSERLPIQWLDPAGGNDGQLLAVKSGAIIFSTPTGVVNGPWTNPIFQNGWANSVSGSVTYTAQYMKDGIGFVHLHGNITGGANGTVAFTLPAGYRPTIPRSFVVPRSGAFGEMTVNPDGTVTVDAGSGPVYIDAINFYAEQ